MVQIPLTSGAYALETIIGNAQRCINLLPEKNPAETKPMFPTTHYVRPGLKLLATAPAAGRARCLYSATNGDLYAVIDQSVYFIDPNYQFTKIGTLVSNLSTPASISDNGMQAVVVDNSAQGYIIDFTKNRAFTQIGDPSFVGSTRVDFLDSFLVLNKPGTNQWYSSASNSATFNALYVGIKTAFPDPIMCAVAIEREIWLFGPKKSEVWYNAGTVPFPFSILPGVIIEQGCVAPYSPAKMDTSVYWLSESPEGARMVMRGDAKNVAQRISTHAIDAELLTYSRVDDAIGSVYQIRGHAFYELHFPTQDITWTYDQATDQWWQDAAIDSNGILHRARNTFTAYAYGLNLALDFANGNLYQIDLHTFTDNNTPIPWIRSFPHFTNELKHVNLAAVVADVSTGLRVGTSDVPGFTSPWSPGYSSGFGPLNMIPAPVVMLRLSRDGGASFGNNRPKQLISSGHYRSMMRWRGNGLARDWVIELSSTAEMCGALNGAYIDPIGASA
jgi:hypothetical protein